VGVTLGDVCGVPPVMEILGALFRKEVRKLWFYLFALAYFFRKQGYILCYFAKISGEKNSEKHGLPLF